MRHGWGAVAAAGAARDVGAATDEQSRQPLSILSCFLLDDCCLMIELQKHTTTVFLNQGPQATEELSAFKNLKFYF